MYTYVHSHLQHFLFNKNFQVSLYNGYINDLPQYGKELPVLQMDQTVAKRAKIVQVCSCVETTQSLRRIIHSR